MNPLSLGGHAINLSQEAEHVGIVRSTQGNMPNILNRISAQNRAIMALLPTGMARSHRGNPAASLRIERLFGFSVLLSGLSSQTLEEAELGIIHHQHKINLERLQRLFPSSCCYVSGWNPPSYWPPSSPNALYPWYDRKTWGSEHPPPAW